MKVLIAPDSFGSSLSPRQAAEALTSGWRQGRPDDEVLAIPMSDGGDGLLDVLDRGDFRRMQTEVAGPLGHPLMASWLLDDRGTAIIESALACGRKLLTEPQWSPMRTTTYGVGQLFDAAREAEAKRIIIGLGGSATVDGGSGSLSGLGFRLRVEDGSGLKIGGRDLSRVASVGRGWSADFTGIQVIALADVAITLRQAAPVFAPSKEAKPEEVTELSRALETWADVAEHDLADGEPVREISGSGAAGGLGFALACGLGARLESGAQWIAREIGIAQAVEDADLVITGEGRLDETSMIGKVAGALSELARSSNTPIAAVVGRLDEDPSINGAFDAIEIVASDGPSPSAASDLVQAAARMAASWGRDEHSSSPTS